MKLKFKAQSFQTKAVMDVVDCFAGQPRFSAFAHQINPSNDMVNKFFDEGFKNADLELCESQILKNIQEIQQRGNLFVSDSLTGFTKINTNEDRVPLTKGEKEIELASSKVHLDIEMETGTGKTYCYIKTIFELNKLYGWSKFIIMVPSIAIREGVYKTLQITADHFTENYGKKIRYFIYNSKRMHELESFSSDAGINVMVINSQAFNASGADHRRIYEFLDDFQTRKPIDVIAKTRPILILDEPQKMEGKATKNALPKFNPLFILRYSATHRTRYNLIHRLDAIDAYNQKLVKKIIVRGIQTRGLTGTNTYLYLEGIDISKKAPVARIEMEVKLKSGTIKRQLRRLKFRDDLFTKSGKMSQYRGLRISQIDYNTDTVELTSGIVLKAGEVIGDVTKDAIRRIQIRETIMAHLDKEKQLFDQGIKVLSLFFIDKVVKYRDYDQEDEKGEYARIFEEEYKLFMKEYLSDSKVTSKEYQEYLRKIDVSKTHKGYFAIDKKTHRLKDPDVSVRSFESNDVDAYNLILKDKERLLSLKESTRFIFSHSALREGWDSPNVFVMCMLKSSDNTISRRQEVGRGLRLCVNKEGERIDHPALVHKINVLTVVTNESYSSFVENLQCEISNSLTSRPRQANESYFCGKLITTDTGQEMVTPSMAKQIYRYLVKNDYTDDEDKILDTYHKAKEAGKLADLPDDLKPYSCQIFQLIDGIYTDRLSPKIIDGRKAQINPLNDNFKKQEFKNLWARINRKAVYQVEFDSEELIRKCVSALDIKLLVTPIQYKIQEGVQNDDLSDFHNNNSNGFTIIKTTTKTGHLVNSLVKYDLIGEVAETTQLTRKTVARIFSQINPKEFKKFEQNPEQFISESSKIITEQKSSMVIERLTYDITDKTYSVDIFMANQAGQDFTQPSKKLSKHIYDYAVTDSNLEGKFVDALDTCPDVVVYAKLPREFLIPTPVGDYNPDWAISFKKGRVKYIYFVAETKGTLSSLKLRGSESKKIECARKFFNEISQQFDKNSVKYDVVTDYDRLIDIVRFTDT